jgi:hypothetical protein
MLGSAAPVLNPDRADRDLEAVVLANDVVVIAGLGMNDLTKQEIQSATMACPDSGFKHRDSPESTELFTCPKVFFGLATCQKQVGQRRYGSLIILRRHLRGGISS